MIWNLFLLILLTFLPFVELRLSIPIGILSATLILPFGITISGMGFNPILVFVIATITNIILGILVFNFLYLFDEKLKKSKVGARYIRTLERAQRKIKPYVKKYAIFGLAIFVGIPIPGSGVYMGSLAGFVIGMEKKDFHKGMIFGVLIAATIVTLLTVLGKSLF